MNGWIKLHRKILDWEWYTDAPVRILYEHLLLTANYEDKKWKGIDVKRGQKVTSIGHLAKETGLTIRQVRTALDKLKMTHNVTIKATNKFTLVTIEKYELFQSQDEKATSNTTSHTANERQQLKKYKNIRNNIYSFQENSNQADDLESLYEN